MMASSSLPGVLDVPVGTNPVGLNSVRVNPITSNPLRSIGSMSVSNYSRVLPRVNLPSSFDVMIQMFTSSLRIRVALGMSCVAATFLWTLAVKWRKCDLLMATRSTLRFRMFAGTEPAWHLCRVRCGFRRALPVMVSFITLLLHCLGVSILRDPSKHDTSLHQQVPKHKGNQPLMDSSPILAKHWLECFSACAPFLWQHRLATFSRFTTLSCFAKTHDKSNLPSWIGTELQQKLIWTKGLKPMPAKHYYCATFEQGRFLWELWDRC